MNERYADEAETTTEDRKRLDREAAQARARRASKIRRKEAHRLLYAMKVLELENAVKRAPRGSKDEAGRTLRLKGNVASMVRQMIFWEGKGEADGDWIYKTRDEWYQEAGLTYRMLRVARDVARDEGLLEYQERGPVGESLVFYRLDMTAVLRVVAASELAVADEWLDRHPRSKKRPEWFKKRKRWKSMQEDLRAWGVADAPDAPETGNPKLGLATDTEGRSPLTTCKGSPDNLSMHQESTPGDVAYSNHSRGEAKPSPLATTWPPSMESDEHAISMNGNETSAMGSDPSEAEEDGRAGTAEEYHEIHDQRAAKMRGGPDGPTGLMIAAALPSCEGLADRFRRHAPTLTEAEALEEDAAAREAALDVLEKVLTEEDG